jgi:hypothetical protein
VVVPEFSRDVSSSVDIPGVVTTVVLSTSVVETKNVLGDGVIVETDNVEELGVKAACDDENEYGNEEMLVIEEVEDTVDADVFTRECNEVEVGGIIEMVEGNAKPDVIDTDDIWDVIVGVGDDRNGLWVDIREEEPVDELGEIVVEDDVDDDGGVLELDPALTTIDPECVEDGEGLWPEVAWCAQEGVSVRLTSNWMTSNWSVGWARCWLTTRV